MTGTTRLAVLFVACIPTVCVAETAEKILESTGVKGGLIVHVGCGDGRLTASLGAADGYLVHGLDADAGNVTNARRYIKSLGLYGKVSVQQLTGQRLPYADNLANLVVSEDLGDVPINEVMRVLCPGGVAYFKEAGQWKKKVKSWPEDIDEWTHFLHGPDNNAVAHDSVVDVPRQMKWLGAPKFARAHEQSASLSACVTTAGRLFYIIDEAPRSDIRIPSQWFLVARDAFNGVVLWKRSIPKWMNQMRRFRSGPAEMAFRLVAKDDRVYVTLGIKEPVSILDAATGKTLATCDQTENARQIMHLNQQLIVLVDTTPESTREAESQIRRGLKPAPGVRVVVVSDASDGKLVWKKEIRSFVHPALAARGKRLYYQTKETLHCVDLESGKEVWQTKRPLELKGHELGWESPTLVVHDDVIFCADFKTIGAYSVADGYLLWKSETKSGYNSPPDVFIINNLVWLKGPQMRGLDLTTGKVKKTLQTTKGYMHPRCYRNKATDRFFLLGNQGVQFVDRESNDASLHHWLRGTCQYGIMPANGLLYVTPDSCACNMKSKLSGFWAIESGTPRKKKLEITQQNRLIKGPAFGRIDAKEQSSQSKSGSWPVFRHDAARSGITHAKVGSKLRTAWKAEVGGKLSGVTAAGDTVFVAAIDEHTVYALDQKTGKTIWTFTAGSRVDSPPTIYKGMALFGSADGWVYALRATDGELAWRFQAAPDEKLTFVNGQLESVWPVHGSLIVQQDKLLVPAGRSSYLDDGIHVYRLDVLSGKMLSDTVMYSPDAETGQQPVDKDARDMRGLLSDILVAEGDDVYMRHVKLDLESGDHTKSGMHLFSPIGLLDDSWWHRAYWMVNEEFVSHWSGWWKAGNFVPSGRILSYDAKSVFGYGRDKYPSGNTGQFRGGEEYQLFACDRPTDPVTASQLNTRRRRRGQQQPKSKAKVASPKPTQYRWVNRPSFHVRAMVVAGEMMFAAGPPNVARKQGAGEKALVLKNPQETLSAWQGKQGGVLWVVSTKDGKRIAQYKLDAPPVFDGMAATAGRLFTATTDGKVVCLETVREIKDSQRTGERGASAP